MSAPAPAARAVLEAIGALDDAEVDIADAALQLARVDHPDADWRAARAHLSELARHAVALSAEIAPDDLSAQAGALAGLLAGRYGYAGDSETFDDLDNANLIRVVDRRRGLPVALGILWLHCAQAAGWTAYGINFPGRFLVGMQAAGAQTVLDVFDGGAPVDAKALRRMLKQVEGVTAELEMRLMTPMTSRMVLLRLQDNILTRRAAAGDLAAALACADDMLRIAPKATEIWRQAALLNERLDHVGAALRCYDRFLALVPGGEAADRVRTAMGELRTRLN